MKKAIFLLIILNIFIAVHARSKVLYGVASYYGRQFHGRRTASGEIFDMYKLTAAHKTLPMGTVLKITNLSNNKTIIVKINDRGPYAGNRILDLSFAAARKLGYVRKGLTKVKAVILKIGNQRYVRHPLNTPITPHNSQRNNISPENTPGNADENPSTGESINQGVAPRVILPPTAESNTGRILRIQIGAFRIKFNADKRLLKLKQLGIKAEIVEVRGVVNYYKIYSIERFRNLNKAMRRLREIKSKGVKCFVIGQYYARD